MYFMSILNGLCCLVFWFSLKDSLLQPWAEHLSNTHVNARSKNLTFIAENINW